MNESNKYGEIIAFLYEYEHLNRAQEIFCLPIWHNLACESIRFSAFFAKSEEKRMLSQAIFVPNQEPV